MNTSCLLEFLVHHSVSYSHHFLSWNSKIKTEQSSRNFSKPDSVLKSLARRKDSRALKAQFWKLDFPPNNSHVLKPICWLQYIAFKDQGPNSTLRLRYLDHYADYGTEGKGYDGFPRPDRIVKSVLGETMLGKEPLYLCLDINMY